MIVNLFSGADGWGEGAHPLGLHPIDLEWERWPCETAHAAGHHTIRADVANYPTSAFTGAEGLAASPPCQAFSTAGKGVGARAMHLLGPAVHAVAGGADPATMRLGLGDDRAGLVLEPVRWVRDLRPRWVALEQVPPVLPLWKEMARVLRGWGYSTWTGLLCAADYGVPQTRTRAILIASLDRQVAAPPPTHCKGGAEANMLDAARRPWVSMAEALGWGFDDIPAKTYCGARQPRWLYDDPDGTRGRTIAHLDRRNQTRGVPVPLVPTDRPAPTVTSAAVGSSQWLVRTGAPTVVFGHDAPPPTATRPRPATVSRQNAEGSFHVEPWEAGVLQSFPPDYPWQGGKTAVGLQIGNAIPPLLATHVLAEATGRSPRVAPATRGTPGLGTGGAVG